MSVAYVAMLGRIPLLVQSVSPPATCRCPAPNRHIRIKPLPAHPSPKVVLRSTPSLDAAWTDVTRPWFETAAGHALLRGEITAVVVPHRTLALALRTRLLERGVSLLGIHFFTPAQLRARLLRGSSARIAKREDLKLLVSVAAEQCPTNASDDETMAARAVARAPDPLVGAMEKLGAAGVDFAAEAPAGIRPIIRRATELLRAAGFTLAAEADRLGAGDVQHFQNLLVVGFDGAHWAHWFLLVAAVKASGQATVILSEPHLETHDLDATWNGSWEEEFGAALPIDAAGEPLSLLRANEQPTRRAVHFLVGRDTTEQAHAIARLTETFLAAGGRRIGLLFPGAGPLPRLVSAALADAEIEHYDTLAHFAPGPFEDRAWSAWLGLQTAPRLASLREFLDAHSPALEPFGGLTSNRVADILARAFDDILIDDLAVLRELCAARRDDAAAPAIAAGLTSLEILPTRATFPQFLQLTIAAFARLGWAERGEELTRLASPWSDSLAPAFSRGTYLRWLAETLSSFAKIREEIADHPYCRVQLLQPPQALEQTWSHLVFCGANEGAWPTRGQGAAYIADEQIAELNRHARRANERAVRQGNQGEGHLAVRAGRALCLGPGEERDIAARHFTALFESAEVGVAFAATLFDEASPGRVANPNEFFTREYFGARGQAVSAEIFAGLQSRTAEWLGETSCRDIPATTSAGVQQTRIAYDARRTETPAGEYEFALREPLPHDVRVSATGWERSMKAPALVWCRAFLGVEAMDSGERSAVATGQWVHRWLGILGGVGRERTFIGFPPAHEIRPQVAAEAKRFLENATALLARCGRPVPDWWRSGWMKAAYLADCFAAKLAGTSGWSELATEWRLHDAVVPVGEAARLSFNGRADLILARANENGGRELWVIDYKTGTKKTLRPSAKTDEELAEKLGRKLRGGEGIQLALYALALGVNEIQNVGITLLSPSLRLDEPQLHVAQVAAQKSFWEALARMGRTGIFGLRGAIRSEFSFSGDYPLATLAIDPELLERKWALTHPTFSQPAEDLEE